MFIRVYHIAKDLTTSAVSQLLILAVPILISKPATAYEIEEWVEVGNSEVAALGNSNSWRVKNLKRQGSTVIFESLSPESEYAQIEGNCRNYQLRILYLGQYNENQEVEYRLVPSHLWHWHKPKTRVRQLLESVCSTGLNQLRGAYLNPATHQP
ncbi:MULTISPECIES: hypothetical protein [Nostocales]|uniref:Uncharacterized protein n=1 Tax=Tolypothrix bouteillei VB521301 TaxID=1479485 RepID=A0A0C1RCB5_9CYAN